MIILKLITPLTPWAPSRITQHGAFNPKRNEKKLTRLLVRSKYRDDPMPGYVAVEFIFYFEPPFSLSATKREEYLKNIKYLPTRCDCTNLQKFYEDCIKNILITDDRNVVKIYSEKLYAEKEGVLIKVTHIGNDENNL